jgi:hypothetical protein
MAKTKIGIRKKRQIAYIVSLFLSMLAFLLVFFELSLTIHGGWDDINYTIIFATPLISALAMIFAIVNITKFRAKSAGLIPALSMVMISALFFCYVMVYTSTALLARA